MRMKAHVMKSTADDDGRVSEVRHTCVDCGRAFLYRHTGLYRDDSLQPIDFVCRACLPAWYARWAVAHGWVPGPGELEAAQ